MKLFQRAPEHTFLLKIEPVIARARQIKAEVQEKLPTHRGLRRISIEVTRAAENAQRNAQRMRSFWALHRLPLYGIILSLVIITWLLYRNFFYAARIRIALPERDTSALLMQVQRRHQLVIRTVKCRGSRHGLTMLANNSADVCFVQGGIAIAPEYLRLEAPGKELILFCVRRGRQIPQDIHTVCTSVKNQGSHTLAQRVLAILGVSQPRFIHSWPAITDSPNYQLPPEVDAVLVVKNMAEARNLTGLQRLLQWGFELRALDLGIHAEGLPYLQPTLLPPGYLLGSCKVPAQPLKTYRVSTYLVAHPRVTAAQLQLIADTFLGSARHALETPNRYDNYIQNMGALSETILNLGILVIGLLGISILSYRQRFNELNTLISLINIHQSTKDLYEEKDSALRREYRMYLATCSDLLGLIDIITGYYAQENPTLLFNGFCSIIHQRCSDLKINIQLKIQHAHLKYARLMSRLQRDNPSVVTNSAKPTPPTNADPPNSAQQQAN